MARHRANDGAGSVTTVVGIGITSRCGVRLGLCVGHATGSAASVCPHDAVLGIVSIGTSCVVAGAKPTVDAPTNTHTDTTGGQQLPRIAGG